MREKYVHAYTNRLIEKRAHMREREKSLLLNVNVRVSSHVKMRYSVCVCCACVLYRSIYMRVRVDKFCFTV